MLLDEPAAGMNPQETESLKHLVLKIRDEMDMAVLLIEHDMNMVMSLSSASTSWSTAASSPAERLSRSAVIRGSSKPILGRKPMLELKNVSTFYGNIQALHDISLTIHQGEIVTLIGPTARARAPRSCLSAAACRLKAARFSSTDSASTP